MSDDLVTIEIDGKPLKAKKGAMVIQVADDAGIYIPRFCYHEKLSVAANCRMCLVEVERAPKPMPACATPVMDGMKVFTDSPKALSAQKGVMEFLLINHPLDCPVCDQGGECELQDLAMGFGSDVSRYTEKKRIVKDKNIGPLISTDMTRCIHCTRCVRFGQEVAGIQELGATGRGENTRIGTYIERSVNHELSGNVIDLCPVGALNSKPFRMRGRSWEMIQHEMVAPHDAAGSNVFGHVLRGRFLRVVPRPNESINETWVSDRDRFSYEGMQSDQRLLKPMIKRDGQWLEATWDEALQAAASALEAVVQNYGAEALGVLASPSSTLEEFHLARKLADQLGTPHIDHRMRQRDFRNDAIAPAFPALGRSIASLENLNAALVIGSSLRKDVPIIAHRIRKAAMKGANISFLNPRAYEFLFPVANELAVAHDEMLSALAGMVKAAAEITGKAVPAHCKKAVDAANVSDAARTIAKQLNEAEEAALILGDIAEAHPQFADIHLLAAALGEMTGASVGVLSGGANSAGGWLAGAVPHRKPGGKNEKSGLNAFEQFSDARKGYLLIGTEPELDSWNGAQALDALKKAEKVVMLSAFVSERMKEYADVLLPIGSLGESSGTFINAEGVWQRFGGASKPLGESRPAWKVLRVLGNLLKAEGFDYMEPEEVTEEARQLIGEIANNGRLAGSRDAESAKKAEGLQRVGEMALYGTDPLVRRAPSLQQTEDGQRQRMAVIGPETAGQLSLSEGDAVTVRTEAGELTLNVRIEDGVPAGSVFIAAGIDEHIAAGPRFGKIELAKA